jgi:hypothetical protein
VKLRKETTREMIKSVRTVSTGHLYVKYFLVSSQFTTSTDHDPTCVVSMLMLSSIFVLICDLYLREIEERNYEGND